MLQTIEQKRASDAYGKIKDLPLDRKTKEYGSKIKRLPAMVQSCGLLPAVGFYASKGDLKDIYSKLEEWFFSADLDFPWPTTQRSSKNLLESLAKIDRELYRMATREALAYLNWLKRAAEALLAE